MVVEGGAATAAALRCVRCCALVCDQQQLGCFRAPATRPWPSPSVGTGLGGRASSAGLALCLYERGAREELLAGELALVLQVLLQAQHFVLEERLHLVLDILQGLVLGHGLEDLLGEVITRFEDVVDARLIVHLGAVIRQPVAHFTRLHLQHLEHFLQAFALPVQSMLDGFHCLAALGQGALLVVQCIELHRGALVVGAQRGLQLFRQHRHRAPTEHSGGLLVARRRGGGRALAAVVAVAMVAVDGRCKRHALLATWRGGVGVDGVARGPDGHSDRNVLLLLRVAGVGGLLRGLLMVVGGVAVRRVLRVMRGGLRVAQRRRRMRRPLTRPAAVQRRLLPADNAERVHQVCQVGLAP
mmetsp:Transcript_9414/g.34543  ORF Transcript_9414/g.34543 Transcript_9414/m.34543 type:complete len:356 (-) Transcript_9414:473-1540(-)